MARSALTFAEYRAIVESSPTMIWRAGTGSKCDYFNETWLEFTGRSLDQEMGDGWAEGVHRDDLARCLEVYLRHFERREPFEMEYRLRRHDGVYRYIFDRGVPFEDEAGRFAGYVGSCVDVDDRRRAEQERAAFLALMSHELRTPLTALRTYLDVAARRMERGEPPGPEILGRVKSQIARFATLVDELSQATRLAEGQELAVSLEPMDLRALAGRTVELFAEALAAKERQLPSESAHRVTFAAPGTCPVRGDADRLEQALAILLENAVKFSPRGGEIRVSLTSDARGCELSVSDPGIGVPQGELPRLTQRYFRASNAPPGSFPGLGLGLSICREIVERHGGAVRARSALDEGTTVTLSLPREDAAWHASSS